MNGTIQFKRKSALHWDSVTFDGLFLTLRELQRAIALKKFPDSLEQAEQAIEVLEGDVKLTDPLKQIPHGSKVAIRFIRVEERRDFQNRRPAGTVISGPGQSQGPVAGAELFGQQADDLEAIQQRMAADEAAPAVTAGRGRGRGGRGGIGGSFGRGFSSRPATCRICGLPDHDAADCPHKDAERKTRVTGIPTANLVPDEKGTLLINGSIPARILPDEQAFQQYVGGSSSAQPPSLPQPASSTPPPTTLEGPPAEPPLALTQFAHADVPSHPLPAAAPALPQLAGEDMVFEDTAFEDSLPVAASRSPLPAKSPQQDPNESQVARLASLELRSKEADMERLLRKQNAMLEPLSMDEFKTLQRLSFEVEKGKQLREQRRLQREREQQARSKPSPPVARRPQRRASVSPSCGRSRRSRERSPVRTRRHAHRSRSRGHRRHRSRSSSGYSSDQHARRNSRRRPSYRSRRYRSTSPSRSPSYHGRDRGQRQATHKRPRTARAAVPMRTGLSSPSRSREPSREATPALAESPQRTPFDDFAAPPRASTPQLAGLEDHDEPLALNDAANKRPRVNRWASGATPTHQPDMALNQQQKQTGKTSVTGRISESVMASATEAEEPRKIRPVVPKAAAVSQPPGKLEGIKYKVPLDGLAHPELSAAAPQEQRPSKRKSKHTAADPAPLPSDPSQPPHPSGTGPPASTHADAAELSLPHDPLDEPPSSEPPDRRSLEQKAGHAVSVQDPDPTPRSSAVAPVAAAQPLSEAAQPSLLEDSVEDLMPVGLMPSAVAAGGVATKPAKEKHSKQKASKGKSSKGSKSRASKDEKHVRRKQEAAVKGPVPAEPNSKPQRVHTGTDGAGSSRHRSSRDLSGKEQAAPDADVPKARLAVQAADAAAVTRPPSRSPSRSRIVARAQSRSPSTHRFEGKTDRSSEQDGSSRRTAHPPALGGAAQKLAQASHSSRHRSKPEHDAKHAGPAGKAHAASPTRPQAGYDVSESQVAAGPAAAAAVEAAPARAQSCSKPSNATSQGHPGAHANGAAHTLAEQPGAASAEAGKIKKDKKHKKDKVKKEKKEKRHKEKSHKKHKHEPKSESEGDTAAPLLTSQADVAADIPPHGRAAVRDKHNASPDVDARLEHREEKPSSRSQKQQSRSSAFDRLGGKGREHQRRDTSRYRESSRSYDPSPRGFHHDKSAVLSRNKAQRQEAVAGVDPSDRWQNDQ
ncbi:hypothetical protein WJX74_004388 [Apatococcus lobatus]|uniref:Uncharacterized protein n=1 Tax=Apatococcus lobatus TaxID=904363 RepID=A0AAW1SAQ6_9CHLO